MSNERVRGRRGVEQRRRRLERTNGLCEMCGAEGRTALADVVDHVVPLIKGGQDVDSNTRNLCHDHHAQVTAEQFGQRAPRVPIGIDGWPVA